MQIDKTKPTNTEGKEMRVRFFNKVARFFDHTTAYAPGDVLVVQIFRKGKWQHPYYGEIIVNQKTFKNIMKNFNDPKNKNKLVLDENHEPEHRALGFFQKVYQEKNRLMAEIKINQRGANILSDGSYYYFSPEIIFDGKDDETGKPIKDLLQGGAVTNKPYFSNMKELMKKVMASRVANQSRIAQGFSVSNPAACFFNSNITMTKLDKVIALLSKATDDNKLTAAQAEELKQIYSEIPEDEKEEALTDTVEEAIEASDTTDTDEDEEETPSDDDKDEEEEEGKEDDEESDEDEEEADSDEDSEEEEDEDKEDDEEEEDEPKPKEKVKASKKTVTITASKLAKYEKMGKAFGVMQKDISKLTRENRKNFTKLRAKNLRFSQGNAKTKLSPLSVTKLSDLVLDFSVAHSNKVFAFLKEMKVMDCNKYGGASDKDKDGGLSYYMEIARKADPNATEKDIKQTAKFMKEEVDKQTNN